MTEDLAEIFRRLRKALGKYEGRLVARIDRDSRYELWSVKEMTIAGRRRKDLYVAGLIIQKDDAGLYYMPVYVDKDMQSVFTPELLRLLKGKSCFHVNHLDANLERQIREALARGFAMYRERGWA